MAFSDLLVKFQSNSQVLCLIIYLLTFRRDWDQFLVPVDHPDGSTIPRSWVLPEPPADDVWAVALEK